MLRLGETHGESLSADGWMDAKGEKLDWKQSGGGSSPRDPQQSRQRKGVYYIVAQEPALLGMSPLPDLGAIVCGA